MAANTTTGRRAPTASDIFIFDENDGAGRPDAHRLGLDLKGWVGTQANGYTHPETIRRCRDKEVWPNTRHYAALLKVAASPGFGHLLAE